MVNLSSAVGFKGTVDVTRFSKQGEKQDVKTLDSITEELDRGNLLARHPDKTTTLRPSCRQQTTYHVDYINKAQQSVALDVITLSDRKTKAEEVFEIKETRDTVDLLGRKKITTTISPQENKGLKEKGETILTQIKEMAVNVFY